MTTTSINDRQKVINWNKLSFYDDCRAVVDVGDVFAIVCLFPFVFVCFFLISQNAYSISLAGVENALKPFVWVVSVYSDVTRLLPAY